MLAAVYHGIGDLRVEEIPEPQFGEDEALLKVRVAAICGTDRRILKYGHFKIPEGTGRVLGHELAGEIAAVGSRVKGLTPGVKVTIAPNIGCGICEQCVQGHNHLCPNYEALGISLDGGFSEYMRIPAAAIRQGNIIEIPEGVSYEEAALNEPLSCCYNGFLACGIKPGDVVFIVGAGPIGIMHLLLAKLGGASKVIVSQRSDPRRTLAAQFGADVVINPTEEDLSAIIRNETQGRGVDVVIIAALAAKAQEEALDWAAVGGRINLFGGLPKGQETVNFDANKVHYKQLTITGTTGSSSYQFRRTMDIIASRRVELSRLVTARFPLKDALKAFDTADARQGLKVVIVP